MLYYNVVKYILTKNFTNKFTERSLTGMTYSAKMPLTYLLTYLLTLLHAFTQTEVNSLTLSCAIKYGKLQTIYPWGNYTLTDRWFCFAIN